MSFRDGPSGPGLEPKNTGQPIDLSGRCSWIPGSRAEPAPRNDDVAAFVRSLLAPRVGVGLMSRKRGGADDAAGDRGGDIADAGTTGKRLTALELELQRWRGFRFRYLHDERRSGRSRLLSNSRD